MDNDETSHNVQYTTWRCDWRSKI